MSEKALTSVKSLGDLDEKALRALVTQQEGVRGSATAEDIRDALGGQLPRLEKIKVIAQAGTFKFEDDEIATSLTGVIAAHTYRNARYDTAFEEREEGAMPDCFSNDGVHVAADVEAPKAANCRVCRINRGAPWGSEARQAAFEADRDETCSNYLVLAVSLPGVEFPYEVRLSQASFKNWGTYVQRIGSRGRFLPCEVATKLSLSVKHGVADYTVCGFEMLGPLPAELATRFRANQENILAALRRSGPRHDDGPSDADAARAAKEAVEAAKSQPNAL